MPGLPRKKRENNTSNTQHPTPNTPMTQRPTDPPSNYQIARVFERIGDLMEIKGENQFKVRAYRRAADTLEGIAEPLSVLRERGELEQIPNVGAAVAAK